MPRPRRVFRAARVRSALGLATVLALAGTACSSSAGSDPGSGSGTGSRATVSIAHAWGTTNFPVSPKRVVVATGYPLDNLLALGVQPVAYLSSPSTGSGLLPWEKVDPSVAVVSSGTQDLPLEKIAAQRPDLIVVNNYQVADQAAYDSLAGIAPTLAATAQLSPTAVGSWTDQLLALGKIFDKTQRAEQVIATDKDRIGKLAAELPGLRGKTAVVAQYLASANSFNLVADPKDPANQLFAQLGMTLPKTITGDGRFQGRTPVSLELLPLLDADYMAVYPNGAEPSALTKLPGYSDLKQVRTGATNVMNLKQIIALNTPSSLSRAWVLDLITPQLRIAATS